MVGNLRGTQKKLIEDQISQEINQLLELRNNGLLDNSEESTIAEKTLKALTTMNRTLQKEIFNYLALKLRLAFAKSGIGIGRDHSSNFLSVNSAEDFFREIEERVS